MTEPGIGTALVSWLDSVASKDGGHVAQGAIRGYSPDNVHRASQRQDVHAAPACPTRQAQPQSSRMALTIAEALVSLGLSPAATDPPPGAVAA